MARCGLDDFELNEQNTQRLVGALDYLTQANVLGCAAAAALDGIIAWYVCMALFVLRIV